MEVKEEREVLEINVQTVGIQRGQTVNTILTALMIALIVATQWDLMVYTIQMAPGVKIPMEKDPMVRDPMVRDPMERDLMERDPMEKTMTMTLTLMAGAVDLLNLKEARVPKREAKILKTEAKIPRTEAKIPRTEKIPMERDPVAKAAQVVTLMTLMMSDVVDQKMVRDPTRMVPEAKGPEERDLMVEPMDLMVVVQVVQVGQVVQVDQVVQVELGVVLIVLIADRSHCARIAHIAPAQVAVPEV